MINKIFVVKIVIVFFASLFLVGFCLITNSARNPKTYIPQDLPFYYRLNDSTPASYYDAIYAGAIVWNNVEGSYFEFQQGENTPVTFVGRDGINLVFFDLQGVNFSDPNVIAFSMTFSSNTPRYRAVESDLVWNAKDHAPSPTGEPFFIDLQSTMAHEFGHHLGLDHTGLPGGASSGCGPLVPSATMWAFATDGDTTGRNLHPEDIIGVTVLYPNWIIEGHVIDATNAAPLKGAKVSISDGYGALLGEINYNYWYTVSGYILQEIPTDQNGFFQSPVTKPSFTAKTDYFGYYPISMEIIFAPPAGYGNTQTIPFNASLLRTPFVNFTGKVFDDKNNIPVAAEIDFFWVDRPDSVLFTVSTDGTGNYNKTLPSNEYYKVRMRMELPYVNEKIFDSVYVDENGFNLDLNLKPVNVLYVVDDPSVTAFEKYITFLNSTGIEYAYTDNDVTPLLPEKLSLFSKPLTLIWASGGSNSSGISELENELLKKHLRDGGYLILAGRNIVEYSIGDSLVEKYIGVGFNGNHLSPFSIRGFSGHPVGNGISFSSSIPSKDIFSLTDSPMSKVYKAFHYGAGLSDTVKVAAVSFEGNSFDYKGFILGFGFEAIGNEETAAEILFKIFDWMYEGAISNTEEETLQPIAFSLSQNYPNPFNPVTTIRYSIPVQEKVTLKIYDTIGREVVTLLNEVQNAGSHNYTFNASGFASGVYYYRLTAGNFSETKKLVLLK